MGAHWLLYPAHVGGGPPVPHWAVLLAVVPAILLVVVLAIVTIDRLLERFGWVESDEKRR